ncbi:MAG TPA: DMT family transporter [Candidatus Nanopelagicaceae bacterium]|nr:DMT family transporter [Candidatus Nanopelagicaceae bacterium]
MLTAMVSLVAALIALFTSLLWGTSDYLGGVLSKERKVIGVVGTAQAMGLVLGALLVVITGQWHKQLLGWGGYGGYAFAAGVIGFGSLLAFYSALSSGTMGVVSPIASLGVIVPVVIGLVRGERPSQLQLLGICIAIIGVVAASGPELSGLVGAKPVLLAILAGAGFGLTLTFMQFGSRSSPLMTMTAMRLVMVLTFGIMLSFSPKSSDIRRSDLPLLALIGTFDLSANVLLGVASTMGMFSIVAVLGSLYPMTTVILAAKFQHERLARIQYVGIVLSILGLVFIGLGGGA